MRDGVPCYSQVGVEVQVSHLTFVAVGGGGTAALFAVFGWSKVVIV